MTLSPPVRFMSDSFTLYGMPLTTASFFQDFRYGTLPIGVFNIIHTYVKLVTTAPEIGGQWRHSPHPATVLADGTQNRYATGSAQTSIMFRNTDRPQEAWEFLSRGCPPTHNPNCRAVSSELRS